MAARAIYEGSIPVNASDYTHPDESTEDYDPIAIEGLDQVLTRRQELAFVLDYPFEKPYQAAVRGAGGITLRQIIDAVRAGYRTMYQGAHHQPIPNLENQIVDGAYGRAYHAIDDLVIEAIELDEEAGSLEVFIGS